MKANRIQDKSVDQKQTESGSIRYYIYISLNRKCYPYLRNITNGKTC